MENKFNIPAACQYIKSHAVKKSTGLCARSVRLALNFAGVHIKPFPDCAIKYHTENVLSDYGFKLLTEHNPFLNGDICVINHGKHGHICIYVDGVWYSDFKQLHMIPYEYPCPYWIYRWKDVESIDYDLPF